MDVTIEAIKFNHDPSSADMDALTIRKNEDEEIDVPEWQGKHLSPAAYVCAPRKGLSIEVQLTRRNTRVQSVEVSAESRGTLMFETRNSTEIKNILGLIKPARVEFGKDELSKRVILFATDVRLEDAGVGKWKVNWDWTITPIPGGSTKLLTDHEIYTVFGPPGPPWGPDKDDPTYEYETPWVNVLEKACRWAVGAQDSETVATQITAEFHSRGQSNVRPAKSRTARLQFNEKRTVSRLAINGTDRFLLSDFLKRFDAGETITVNCTDCAILVSTFANILGCNLYQSKMGPGFNTNYIRPIGLAKPERVYFRYHEVAWQYPCDHTANLFDCFLELDGDPKPSVLGFDPLLPANIPFGDHKSATYHFRLIQKGELCKALHDSRTRRKITRGRFAVRELHPEIAKLLMAEFSFLSMLNLDKVDRSFPGPIQKIDELLPTGWNVEDSRVLTGDAVVPELRESIWQDTSDRVVRALCYRCASVPDALAFLFNLLGEFQSGQIKPLFDFSKNEASIVGDFAFSGAEAEVLLFSRSNVVVFLQSVGGAAFSVLQFAHDFDRVILKALGETAQANPTKSPKSPESTAKKERMMTTDFSDTVWSSIRPSTATATPAHMARDGVFRIEYHEPRNGTVRGRYYDLRTLDDVDFEGSIRYVQATYSFMFSHDVPRTDRKRYYEGYLVGDDGDVSIIGGRWWDYRVESVEKNGEKNNDDDKTRGQDEGVWVATKP